MGQKVHPRVMRLGMSEQWRSRWYRHADYATTLRQDVTLRRYLAKKLAEAGIDKIDIERYRGEIVVNIITAKPGIVIGRGGTGIEDVKKELMRKYIDPKTVLKLNVQEVENANLSAGAVLQACVADIEKRMPFRRVMKLNIDKVMKAGAQGVKIMMSGRLNGADIARRETLTQGKIPLHTLRADINYARGAAQTTFGVIGIKVWIYKGLYFPKKDDPKQETAQPRKAPVSRGIRK